MAGRWQSVQTGVHKSQITRHTHTHTHTHTIFLFMPALTSHSHSTQPKPVTLSSMWRACSALSVSYLSPPQSFFSLSSLFFSTPTSHKWMRSDAGKIGHVGRKCCSSGLGSFSSSLSVSQFKVVRCMSVWDVREGGTQWHTLMEALKHINHPCLCDQANV